MVEFYLKILSGNHIGAEIPLEPGRYSLGKDENCDLVLTDASVHEIELILEISEEGDFSIQTSTAEEALYLNGEPAGSSIQCDAFDIITSSGLFFALGPVDADWPELTLPELKQPEQEETPSEPPVSDEGEFPDTEDEPEETESFEDEELPLPDLDDDSYEEDEDEDEQDNLFPDFNRKWLLVIPAALLITIALIFALNSSTSESPAKISYLKQAQQVQSNLRLKHIAFKEQTDKTLLISGYVSSGKKKRELQRTLRERNIPFNNQVIAMDELRSNAQALLQSRGYKSLQLEQDVTPGSLVLTGYLATAEELDQLIASLKQEIHGLISVVDQIENQAGRINTLKSMIREKGLAPRVHLVERPGKVILQGHLLDEGQVYSLQDLVKRFRDRYGNNPTLVIATKSATGTTTTSSAPGIPVLPSLNIRGISMGRVPYVVMEDGSKYLVGAKLANGYIIEDINLEYLLLTNGTDRIKYRLGGNRGGQ